MVRFSCFHANNHSYKPKKTVQNSAEAVQKTLEDCSKEWALKDFTNSSGTSPLHLKVQVDSNSADHVAGFSSMEYDWKSEESKSKHNFESDLDIHKIGSMKKCLSLGSALDRKGAVAGGSDSDGELDKEVSCYGSNDCCPSVTPVCGKDPGSSLPDLSQEALPSDSVHLNSDVVKHESIYSVGDQQPSESEVHEDSDTKLSNHMPIASPVIVKSKSLPNIISSSGLCTIAHVVAHSRSFEDLNALDSRLREILIHEVGRQAMQDHERDNNVFNNEENSFGYPSNKRYDTYEYVVSAKDWIIPVIDEVKSVNNRHTQPSLCPWNELPNKDFKIKRIEQWVMDLQHCCPLEEMDELFTSNDYQVQNDDTVLDGLTTARLDVKDSPGMEAAKKYISSLGATSTMAQLANYGLAVIPFLSAFVNLRALNLSGNSIVRITAGALPRGLHVLNLSRNNISIIEGLRELTRLRVLDLSYNRIFRIGHGLASCTSLKELYLAGNKINEVEGLHRLLKLNVLDLRFNKISTSKCLGQLAANYNSLQAIRLEGNPAQKNVGDEQLKKYLQGLLPHLSYYNMQSVRVGTLKDVADRSARLGLNSHHVDRGLRSDMKTMWKGSHGVAAQKMPYSSTHGRKTQASASRNASRSRHICLPPGVTKPTTHQNNVHDFSNKLLSFKAGLSMRRSRSEGTLGAL